MSNSNPFFYYSRAFKNYVNFKGRASRREYWFFVLADVIIMFAFSFLYTTFVGRQPPQSIMNIYALVTFLPSLACGVRRMHDSNHSGWWVLLPIVNLIFALYKGTPASNDYGSVPEV